MRVRSLAYRHAFCPVCRRKVAVFLHYRMIFVHHGATGRTHGDVVCEGSGWLVEDEDYAAGSDTPMREGESNGN